MKKISDCRVLRVDDAKATSSSEDGIPASMRNNSLRFHVKQCARKCWNRVVPVSIWLIAMAALSRRLFVPSLGEH
jgi:hypothetical protein